MFNKLIKVLDVPEYKIKKHNLKYYYLKQPELCCKYNLSPINDSVKPYEFGKAINILNEYYKDIKSDYYSTLLSEAKNLDKNILTIKPNETLDHIILEYVKFRKDTYIIILWPNAKNNLEELKTLLIKHGNIYYIRKLKLHYDAAINLLYQLYSDVTRLSTITEIKKKLDYIGWKENEVMSFKIIVFDHNSDIAISGSQAPLKEQIRNIWLKDNSNLRGDDFIHVNDNFFQTIEYCKLFLIRNSLIMLHNQNLKKHIDDRLLKCRIYINTIKNWIVANMHPIDFDRLLFMSSSTLYTYGIRNCRDVDGIMSQYPINSFTNNLQKKIIYYFYNRKTKFYFAEINIPNTNSWKPIWNTKNLEWYKKIGIKHIDELIFDPKYYFCYNGLKFTIIKVDIIKRLLRKRFSDYGDLLEIENQTGIKIKLPKIPSKYSKDEFVKLLEEYMQQKYPNNKNYMEKIKKLLDEI